MEKRVVGNRRSEEELEQIKIELNKKSYLLSDQPNFKGTPKQLEMMQNFERAYIDGSPIISDEEFDLLKEKFNYQESLTAISPSGREWIKLLSPLPSIDKAGSLEEIEEFLSRFPNEEFIVEVKLDGLSANLRYIKNKDGDYELDCVTTRGNGRYGLKLHPHALSGVQVNGAPKIIEGKYIENIYGGRPEIFEIRGEAVIRKTESNVEKYADGQEKEDMEAIVWRSIAAGMFNRKVPANLPGLLMYLYDKTLDELIKEEGYYDEKFDCVVYKEKSTPNGRLIASLSPNSDQYRFLRTNRLYICEDGRIIVTDNNDEIIDSFYDKGENISIVAYSCSINGVNKDVMELKDIPGIIHVSQVRQIEEDGSLQPTQFYKVLKGAEEIMKLVYDFYGYDYSGKRDFNKVRYRNRHEYALDGIVIKLKNSTAETQGLEIRNSKTNRNRIVVPKYPNDAIACKLLSEIVRVKLEKIEYTTTELGNVTCSGILDKPYQTESGAIVQRINLHNLEWLESNSWIKEGGEYDMIMSMDIIPVLLKPNE